MRVLNLYTTLGCHLCDTAAAMVEQQQMADIELSMVEISDSTMLMDNYGLRIPVLKFQDASVELAWPFDADELANFLQAD